MIFDNVTTSFKQWLLLFIYFSYFFFFSFLFSLFPPSIPPTSYFACNCTNTPLIRFLFTSSFTRFSAFV